MLMKTKCTDAKLDTIDFDGLQCLVYVARFRGLDFAEYRARLLRKQDQSEKITLNDLTAECQLINSCEEYSRMLEGGLSINAVHHKKNFNRSKKKFKQQQQKGTGLIHYTLIQTRNNRYHSVIRPTTPPQSSDQWSRSGFQEG
ncbi:hypothetical protein Y032_0825g2549 [Ancylostoma ceylanicum]|uniref:Uncharacterized protein n=1 Tax=Ancylostoma ceylanicum TaxID=53326 RepID=A0A016WCV7_9BILA|nr:hypothetical protein Y032_0825g2549 [Ancylostoma ceylanicum]